MVAKTIGSMGGGKVVGTGEGKNGELRKLR
jgi:hypothetical protein